MDDLRRELLLGVVVGALPRRVCLNNFGDAVSVVFPIENSLNFTFPAPAPLVELPTVVGFSTPKLKSFISKVLRTGRIG